jgi:UDP-GlcNAc:undecaprenyl-phosphate GlcNAc-1-phosphate transferase
MENLLHFLLSFGCALAASAAAIPLILRFAHRKKLYDSFNERKIHSGNIPRLGGVGVFIGFAASLVLMVVVDGFGFNGSRWVWTVLAGTIIVFTVGLIDDFQEIRARFKLLLELTAAMLMVSQDFVFVSIRLPFGLGSIPLGAFGYILTFVWIIGITNSINLIDGMDGLAGSLSSMIALTCGAFFIVHGNVGAALLCFALVGAVLGFLFYNRTPAKIFMGDAGALFLGFSISVFPLVGPAVGRVEIGFVPAVTMLIIPIFDTLSAMLRRLRIGVSIFAADKLHVHHKILDLGFSSQKTLALIAAAQAYLCLVAMSYLVLPIDICFPLNVGSWILFCALFVFVGRLSARRRAEAGAKIIEPLKTVEEQKHDTAAKNPAALRASVMVNLVEHPAAGGRKK